MNFGTKLRTVLVIATCLNTALLATDVAQFGNEAVNLVYRILSVAANFVIVFCATWYNNDYTEAAAMGTGVTRQIKAEQKTDYYGDFFYVDDEADEIVEENVDDTEIITEEENDNE